MDESTVTMEGCYKSSADAEFGCIKDFGYGVLKKLLQKFFKKALPFSDYGAIIMDMDTLPVDDNPKYPVTITNEQWI